MNLAYYVCLDDFVGQVRNLITWGKKLGYQAKSKENVNTLTVTYLKQ